MVDTDGRGLVLDPHPAEASPPSFAGRGPKPPPPADVQDRDGAVPVLRRSRRSYPLHHQGFRGPKALSISPSAEAGPHLSRSHRGTGRNRNHSRMRMPRLTRLRCRFTGQGRGTPTRRILDPSSGLFLLESAGLPSMDGRKERAGRPPLPVVDDRHRDSTCVTERRNMRTRRGA